MAERQIKLRWASSCGRCSADLAAKKAAWWDDEQKTARCLECPAATEEGEPASQMIARGTAGGSAQRKYEQKSKRELARKQARVEADAQWRETVNQKHPIVGRIITATNPKPAITPESHATRAWGTGADGERRLGDYLDGCEGVIVLHDRRVKGTKGNIDHLVVSPLGVSIVDAKHYSGKVEKRDLGGWFRSDERLYVDGRDRTKLITGMRWQFDAVRSALGEEDGVDVFPFLCFVGAHWPLLFARPLVVRGVNVTWPTKLGEHLAASGPLDAEQIATTAEKLAIALPPA